MAVDVSPKILKTSRRYWVKLFANFAWIIGIGAVFWDFTFFSFWGFVALIVTLALFIGIKRGLSAQIAIAPSSIRGRVGKQNFDLAWADIKAIGLSREENDLSFIITTETDSFFLPLKYFEKAELEKRLHNFLPEDIFSPLAYRNLAHYKEWLDANAERFNNLSKPLKVYLGRSDFELAVFYAFIGLLFAFLDKPSMSGAFSLGVLVIGVCLCAWSIWLFFRSVRTAEATKDSITIRTLFTELCLEWDAIREAYIHTANGSLGLVGEKYRIILPNQASWMGKDQDALKEYIAYRLDMAGIGNPNVRR